MENTGRPLMVPPWLKARLEELGVAMEKAFDETKHRRHPKGSPKGGKFMPKGGGEKPDKAAGAAQGSQRWSDWRRSKPLPGQDHATGKVNINDALKYTGPPVDLDDAEHAQDASAYLAEMRSAAVGAIYQYRDELVDFADATGLPMPEVDAFNEAVSLIEGAGAALHQRVAPDLPS